MSEIDPQLKARLLVDRWSASCSACGRSADMAEKSHRSSGANLTEVGCGSIFSEMEILMTGRVIPIAPEPEPPEYQAPAPFSLFGAPEQT